MKEYLNILYPICRKMKVLYVEDYDLLREDMEQFLLGLFDTVTTAKDGKEALELYKNAKFDIIITDIEMPVMDGVLLTKHIRLLNPEQLIIVTSAYNESQYLIPLLRMGVENFVTKPIDTEQFITVLLKTSLVFEKNRAREEKIVLLEEKSLRFEHIVQTLREIIYENSAGDDEKIADIKTLLHKITQLETYNPVLQMSEEDERLYKQLNAVLESLDTVINQMNSSEVVESIADITQRYEELSSIMSNSSDLDGLSRAIVRLLDTLGDISKRNDTDLKQEQSMLCAINNNIQSVVKRHFIYGDKKEVETITGIIFEDLELLENLRDYKLDKEDSLIRV